MHKGIYTHSLPQKAQMRVIANIKRDVVCFQDEENGANASFFLGQLINSQASSSIIEQPTQAELVKKYRDVTLGLEIVPCLLCRRYFSSKSIGAHSAREHKVIYSPATPSCMTPNKSTSPKPHEYAAQLCQQTNPGPSHAHSSNEIIPGSLDQKLLLKHRAEEQQNCEVGGSSSKAAEESADCELCGMHLKNEADLVVHKFVEHRTPERDKIKAGPGGIIQCHDCDETFLERKALYWHRQEHHLFRCSQCNDSFSTSGKLAEHTNEMGQHKAEFECTDCGLNFADKMRLKIHRKRHLRKFQCDICKKNLSSAQSLSSHRLIKHIGSSNPFKCKLCKKAFPYSTSLRYHMRTHGDKLIVCQFCGLKFHFAFNYKRHVELHHGRPEDKVVCEHCGGLYSKLKMRDHLARHGDATLPCQLCGKKFRLREQLHRHKYQFHKETPPHTCPMCSKGFVKPENLVAHFSKKHKDTFCAVQLAPRVDQPQS